MSNKPTQEFIPLKRKPGDPLDQPDAVSITHFSASHLYKLVMDRGVPHYKCGGKILFKPTELQAWIEKSKVPTAAEIEQEAADHVNRRHSR